VKKTEQIFEMFTGPAYNSYIAPSGHTYRITKGKPFVVEDERDVQYFSKKNSCFKSTAMKKETPKELKKRKVTEGKEAEKELAQTKKAKKEEDE